MSAPQATSPELPNRVVRPAWRIVPRAPSLPVARFHLPAASRVPFRGGTQSGSLILGRSHGGDVDRGPASTAATDRGSRCSPPAGERERWTSREGSVMTPDEHKAIARRFFEEVWNQQKLEAIDEIFAPTVVFNGQSVDRDTFRQVVAARRAAFPDIHVTVEDQVAEGNKVSTRRTWQGTHQGSYRGVDATVGGSSGARSALCASSKEGSWRTGPWRTSSASCSSSAVYGMTHDPLILDTPRAVDVQPRGPADRGSRCSPHPLTAAVGQTTGV
jgi:predicted ester cyclase